MRISCAVFLLLGTFVTRNDLLSSVRAITENKDDVTMRDAGASKDRPRLDAYDMDAETAKAAETKKEAFSFNADVSRLMDIIINSLYTKKEVFIRELVSNASDALDKARFISVQQPDWMGENKDLEIRIDFDNQAKTVSITDTGVGMSKAELVKNLGTVAKSGTTAFLEAMGHGESMSMIGQFGVGFYSAFLVANKVEVTSKSNDDEQHIWTSTADAKFFVTKDPRGDTLGRGTRVTLHLKDDAAEYVEQERIKNLVKKYSEFINYPIKLYLSKDVREQVPDEDEKPAETKAEGDEEKSDGETQVTDEEETDAADKPEPKTKTVTKTVWDWETLNEIKAIWMREKADITEREYNEFYKSISKDTQDPLAYTHFSAEGEIEFKAILYVPKQAPYDMFEHYYGKSGALKLYVRRVLITEEFEDLMPKYLNFIKGVVDSDDLPLNVSREQLQQMKMIKVMSKKLVRKAIDMIKTMAEEEEDDDDDEYDEDDENSEKAEGEKTEGENKEDGDAEDKNDDEDDEDEDNKYAMFWEHFGKSVKLGVIEDASNRNKLAKLLRFYSTNDTDTLTSMDEYISRMKSDQDTILYLPGDSKEAILKSPILKKYVKQGYEVLLMADPIDEFCTQHLSEYEKRKVKSIAKDDVSLIDGNDDQAKKKLQKLKEMYKPLTDWWKKFLGKDVEKVVISNKLDEDPLYILTSQYGYSATMEKINRAQAFQNQEKTASYMLAKKTLELNPHHSIMKELLSKVKDSSDGKLGEAEEDMARLLFHMALLNSGFNIEDPSDFAGSLSKLINTGFGLARDQPVEMIEIELDDETQSEEGDNEIEEEEISLDSEEKENAGQQTEEPEMQEIPVDTSGQHDDL